MWNSILSVCFFESFVLSFAFLVPAFFESYFVLLLCAPEDSELQCVPGRFESVEEYVRVFEPLLFEECRAQLYSTWEESAETNAHIMVRIKSIERRERGIELNYYCSGVYLCSVLLTD
jgi:senataxin